MYFVSGLDGYVIHLLDGRNEVLSFEYPGQIRDIDSGNEEHTVYFSVVPTPQNGEPLADGKIYRRDLWAGQPSEAATIRQADIGGNWWGTFAIQDGTTYIATFESPSRIFKLTSDGPEQVFTGNQTQNSWPCRDERRLVPVHRRHEQSVSHARLRDRRAGPAIGPQFHRRCTAVAAVRTGLI